MAVTSYAAAATLVLAFYPLIMHMVDKRMNKIGMSSLHQYALYAFDQRLNTLVDELHAKKVTVTVPAPVAPVASHTQRGSHSSMHLNVIQVQVQQHMTPTATTTATATTGVVTPAALTPVPPSQAAPTPLLPVSPKDTVVINEPALVVHTK
jgi:hypothetical protein